MSTLIMATPRRPATARSTRSRKRTPSGPSPKANGRAAGKRQIEDRIVSAALHLFNTKGFDATTTRAISRRAGVADGTLFNYFKTKEDIALHFFEKEVDAAIAAVRKTPRLRNAPLEEQLFALIQSQLEYLAPHERFIGAALIHALRPASRLGPFSARSIAIQQRYLAFVQELIEDAAAAGEVTPLSWWVAEVFWIYYMGVLLFWLQDRSPGKQHTLAVLDRSLSMGVAMIRPA